MEASNNPDQERQDAAENNQKNTPARTSPGNRQIKRSVQKRKQRSKKRKTPTRRMRKRNVVVLWLVAIGLLVSMVISFTPTLGNLTGSQLAENPAFFVNDEAITELQVAQARQNPLFGAVTEGEVAEDLELLLVSQLIDNTVLRQAAADTRVTRAEVREAVEEYRVARGVSGRGNDSAYLQLINNQGFTDETFRDFQREQIRQRKFIESLTDGVTVTDTEVEDFYTANQVDYVSEPQIVARQIVVEDEDLANTLHARALRGEDFAALASENSTELAEVSGAVQADDEGNPQPISRAALPTSVSSAAFGLQGQGITDVVSTGGLFYIVQVLDYLPADVRPFDEVADQVREDALAAKESALLQETLRNLRQDAALEFPEDSEYDFDNDVVATVGEDAVRALELAEATYLNQQVQQFLSPQNAEIVASFFKPSSLEQLIEQKLALQGADSLDATFVGSEGVIARSALNYVANDAEVTEEDLQAYYEANQDRFTIPASATALRLDFANEDAAFDFRNLILEEDLDLEAVAERASNEALVLTDLGTVEPGQLDSEVDRYLFGTEAFTAITEDSPLEVSDVIIIETTVEETEETTEGDSDTLTLEAAETTTDEAATETTDETTDEVTDETSAATSDETADASDVVDAETATAGDAVADTETGTETSTETDTDTDTVNDETDAVADADTEATEAADTAETTDTLDADTATSDEGETTAEAMTETTYTLLVAIRTPERVRSLDEVRAQVRETVLNTERSELQQAWLTALRESIPVENLIAEQPATVPATTPDVQFTTEPAPEVADPEVADPEATETEATETGATEADEATEDDAENTEEDGASTDDAEAPEATADDAEAPEAEVIEADDTTEAESTPEDSTNDAETGESEDSTNETDEGVDTAPEATDEGDTSTDEPATDEPATDEPAEATDAEVIEADVIEAEDSEDAVADETDDAGASETVEPTADENADESTSDAETTEGDSSTTPDEETDTP